MFGDCRRKYYYHYYHSWGGWKRDDPEIAEDVKKAYLLKQLLNLDVWAGKVVDKAVDFALTRVRSGMPMAADELLKWVLAYARQTRDESEKELWRSDPKRYFALYEHYYGEQVPRARWAALREKVEKCVTNFPQSEAYQVINSAPISDWVRLDKKGERVAYFSLDGLKVYAQIDFTLRRGGGYLLIDWKSGKQREGADMDQLSVYALYAVYEMGCALTELRVAPVYLLQGGRLNEQTISQEQLDRIEALIHGSSHEMAEYLYNPVENIARIEDFDLTPDVWRCASCNFKEICEGARREASGPEEPPPPWEDEEPI
jgi:CRISPR/Cas system-associated exonuclease Cas4 (RecB family)